MAEGLWYCVWTRLDGETRIAGETHYYLANSISDAARQAEEEFPHLQVTSVGILRRPDGSWVCESDEDARWRVKERQRV